MANLETDFKKAAIEPGELAALEYAVKLTKRPYDMTKEDIDVLRTQGFNDRGIHDICAVTSYFAFVNRIADGLGVELEDRFDSI